MLGCHVRTEKLKSYKTKSGQPNQLGEKYLYVYLGMKGSQQILQQLSLGFPIQE